MSNDILSDLKTTVHDLIVDLMENVFTRSEEQGDLVAVEFFFKRMHPERVMNHSIKHILPHREKIMERDVGFFLNNKGIFAGLPDDRVDYYSNIIAGGERLSPEDQGVIWEYFDTIIYLVSDWKKNK